MPRKAVQGTPYYSILSNPAYYDAFAYIGPHVDERDKLIRDGDGYLEGNCEQSDIVNILLNLSAIPDEVVK